MTPGHESVPRMEQSTSRRKTEEEEEEVFLVQKGAETSGRRSNTSHKMF